MGEALGKHGKVGRRDFQLFPCERSVAGGVIFNACRKIPRQEHVSRKIEDYFLSARIKLVIKLKQS